MGPIKATHKYNIIYVYKIDDDSHRGALKIGKAEIDTTPKAFKRLTADCPELRAAALPRIYEQTQTAGVKFDLLYVEVAHFTDEDGEEAKFYDTDIHLVLSNSGYKRHYFPDLDKQPTEWYEVELDKVKDAIDAVKQGRLSIKGSASKANVKIVFREEQQEAIDITYKHFRVAKTKMLWNAKMRFGKTLCALELIRKCAYKKTLILTHRPSVKSGWFEDYQLIKFDNYEYGSKPSADTKNGQPLVGETFDYLTKCGNNFIYFASMQDLRGSWKSKDIMKKNEDVFNTKWDLVIIDEAHEGTQTDLGKQVLNKLKEKHPHFLYLSGTPYNIMNQFNADEIYTWDYVMEQDAKENWSRNHPDEKNPYEGLAHLNILTYNLGTAFENYNHSDEDYFEFSEFFRTWKADAETILPAGVQEGDFVHEDDIKKFLLLLHKQDSVSNYPFSKQEYIDHFAHTFWVLPGVDAAAALSKLLQVNEFFKDFKVVNVAGAGDKMAASDDGKVKDKIEKDCVAKVKKAIQENDRTITLSCTRMTTGVSIEEWTAVFMLSGSYNTKASTYLQTIFRSQTPIKHYDYIKKECYAFDFAPDRTLTVIDEYIKSNSKYNRGNGRKHSSMTTESFCKHCSIIAIDGSKTIEYDAKAFMKRVNRVYTEHVIQNGGKDRRLYVNYSLFNDEDRAKLAEIAKKIADKGGAKKKGKSTITVTSTGGEMTPPEGGTTTTVPTGGEDTPKTPSARKPKDKEAEERKSAFDVLDQISVRLPMMIFGTIDKIEGVNFQKFIDDIDLPSWQQFMPSGLTKELFGEISHLYNNDVFVSWATTILEQAQEADKLPVTERVPAIASILSTFHYPDGETVLTPWRVVNMHMSETVGGYDFFDETHKIELTAPRFVDNGEITRRVFKDHDTRILEINSKSGVYPLYLAYSVFREQAKPVNTLFGETMELSAEGEKKIWKNVVEENIFVICKTAMAEKITRRVLAGYDKTIKLNTKSYENIIDMLKDKKQMPTLIHEIGSPSTYGNNRKKKQMKFSAIVSNPPYQTGTSKDPLYHHFVSLAKQINPEYISMIMPAKWYDSGKNLDKFREEMLNDKQLSLLVDFENFSDCFSGVDIAGGVCYFLREKAYTGLCKVVSHINGEVNENMRDLASSDTFVRHQDAVSIIDKVNNSTEHFFNECVSSQKPFGLRTYVIPTETGDLILRYNQGKGAFRSDLVLSKKEWIDKWKVITSYRTNEHAGQTDKEGKKRILSTTEILKPKEICTETYIVVYTAETEGEATNVINYLKTKFVRFLIAMRASTQTLSKKSFANVPILDFSRSWNDNELYEKYELSSNEIEFIDSLIKPM